MHSCNGGAWLSSWSTPRPFPSAPITPEGECCDAASQSGRPGCGHSPEYARTTPSLCDPFGKRNLVDTEKTYLSFPVSTVSRLAFSPAVARKAMRSRSAPSDPREHRAIAKRGVAPRRRIRRACQQRPAHLTANLTRRGLEFRRPAHDQNLLYKARMFSLTLTSASDSVLGRQRVCEKDW